MRVRLHADNHFDRHICKSKIIYGCFGVSIYSNCVTMAKFSGIIIFAAVILCTVLTIQTVEGMCSSEFVRETFDVLDNL